MNTEEKLNQYVLHSYGRYPMAAVRGEGSRLWDSTGKCYLDFCAGIATCVLGHCHPAVTQALQKQAATLVPLNLNLRKVLFCIQSSAPLRAPQAPAGRQAPL